MLQVGQEQIAFSIQRLFSIQTHWSCLVLLSRDGSASHVSGAGLGVTAQVLKDICREEEVETGSDLLVRGSLLLLQTLHKLQPQ